MRYYKYLLLLFFVTFIMGAEFPVIKIGLKTVPPLLFISLRFLLAFLILIIIYFKDARFIFKKGVIFHSLVLSSFLFLGFLTANFGIKFTTATNSGFYISLTVLFTPILEWLFFKKSITKKVLLCVFISTIGIFLISTDSGKINFNTGDLLCLISALCYSLHIIFTALYVKRHNPSVISLLQIGFVSIWGWIGSLILENIPKASSIGLYGWMSLVFTGVIATALVYTVQSFAQTEVLPSNIGIIYTLEPLFAAALSFIMLGERIGLKGIAGGIFIVSSAIICSKLTFKSKSINICIDS